MKKLIVIALVLLLAAPCFGAVGVKYNGSSIGTATDIDFTTGLTATSDGSTATVTGTAGGAASITSGTINGAIIGGTTPVAGTFTTLNSTGGGSLTGTHADLGTVTTVAIRGGTIDNTVIGGVTPLAGTFTTLNSTGGGSLTGTHADLGTVTTAILNGGTVNNVVIGGVTPLAGSFTALNSTSSTSTGAMTFKSNVIASGYIAGVTTMAGTTVTNISSAYLAYGVIAKTVGSETTGTLADGTKVGQMITIYSAAAQGANWAVTPTTKTGFTSFQFTAAKQSITLMWLDVTNGWIIVGNNGCTIA